MYSYMDMLFSRDTISPSHYCSIYNHACMYLLQRSVCDRNDYVIVNVILVTLTLNALKIKIEYPNEITNIFKFVRHLQIDSVAHKHSAFACCHMHAHRRIHTYMCNVWVSLYINMSS